MAGHGQGEAEQGEERGGCRVAEVEPEQVFATVEMCGIHLPTVSAAWGGMMGCVCVCVQKASQPPLLAEKNAPGHNINYDLRGSSPPTV